MRGEADAANLTAAALALLGEVAPALSGDLRFRTLMAVAALKMAERERDLAQRLRAAEDAVIRAGDAGSAPALQVRLRDGSQALTPELHAALVTDAVVRTAVTKPGALTGEERRAAGV